MSGIVGTITKADYDQIVSDLNNVEVFSSEKIDPRLANRLWRAMVDKEERNIMDAFKRAVKGLDSLCLNNQSFINGVRQGIELTNSIKTGERKMPSLQQSDPQLKTQKISPVMNEVEGLKVMRDRLHALATKLSDKLEPILLDQEPDSELGNGIQKSSPLQVDLAEIRSGLEHLEERLQRLCERIDV